MSYVEYLDHGRQCLAEAIQWHKAKNPNLTAAELTGYGAGFMQAWLAARSDMLLHGNKVPVDGNL